MKKRTVKVDYPLNITYPEKLDDLKGYVIVKDKLGKAFIYDKDGNFKTLNINAKEALITVLGSVNFDKTDGAKISSKEEMVSFMEKNTKLKEGYIAYRQGNSFVNGQVYDEAEKSYKEATELGVDNNGEIEMRLGYSQDMQCFKIEDRTKIYIHKMVLRFYSHITGISLTDFHTGGNDKTINIDDLIKEKKGEFNKDELEYLELFEKNRDKINTLKDNGKKNLETAIQKGNYKAAILLGEIYGCEGDDELQKKYFDMAISKLSSKEGETLIEIRRRILI